MSRAANSTDALFTGIRLRVWNGKWHQRTFRPPWRGRPLTEWLTEHAPNTVRRLSIQIGNRWFSKSACNSEVMFWEREGRTTSGAANP